MDQVTVQQPDILRPAGWEIGGLVALLLFYAVMNITLGEPADEAANFIGAVWFGGILVAGAVRAVRIDPVAMWTGVFWFRLASAVYFGFGSAGKVFFNEYTTQLVDSYYWASPTDLFKVNVLCALSLFLFLTGLYVIGVFLPFKTPKETEQSEDTLLWFCGLVFCIIGYSIKYMLVVSAAFNLYGGGPSSGAFASLTYLAVAGLFLLTLWCSKYAITYLVLPTLLLSADILTGALQMNKGEVIFPLIVYSLGLCRYRASVRRLAAAAAAVLLMFVTLVPAVQFGRAELERRYGSIDAGDLNERFEILSQYVQRGGTGDSATSEMNSFARLYYANATVAAVNQFDAGQPGNSLADAYTIFIPRALWPDKPSFDVGARFNLSVVGDANSSSWMGIFAEAYWNLGWIGVPLVMIPLAGAYHLLGRMAIGIQKQSKWFHFPVALLNVLMGMRVDAEIVETQLALFVMCMIIYYFASTVETPLRSLLQAPLRLGSAASMGEAR